MGVKEQDELLRYYSSELTYLRRMGSAFAERYPKIAARLELSGEHSADPHVERLIESFAFLTARIQRQIEADFPQISASLLGVLYPHLVNPVPPMAIAQFNVDPSRGKITTGHLIPKGTPIFTHTGEGLTCRFRTCYPVTLWPFEVLGAWFESPAQFGFLDRESQVTTVLRLKLAARGAALAESEVDTLRFHVSGDSALVNSIYELLFAHVHGVVALPESGAPVYLPPDSIRPVGFAADEDVLPYPQHALPAYRLLQEYFAFPQKFHFFDLCNLSSHRSEQTLDILILLREQPRVKHSVDRNTFRLGCTPIINLFRKTSEPIRLDETQTDYRLVPDIRRERTHEVHSIISVSASSNPLERAAELDPFFSFRHQLDGREQRAFWMARRIAPSQADLPGTEVRLAFLDLDFNPAQPPMQTVYAHMLCTNRDLATHLGSGARLQLEEAAPVAGISCLDKPTYSTYPPQGGATLWALISSLSLNYLSLAGEEEGLAALREILRLYCFSESPAAQQQVEGVRGMSSRRVVRRAGNAGRRGFCQGTEITLRFDEDRYVGNGAFLFGAVLNRFFALYASVNSFTELVMTSMQREGEWKRWTPLAGTQPVL